MGSSPTVRTNRLRVCVPVQDSPAYIQQIGRPPTPGPNRSAPAPRQAATRPAPPPPAAAPVPPPPAAPAPKWGVQVASTPPGEAARRAGLEAGSTLPRALGLQAQAAQVAGRARMRLIAGPFGSPELARSFCAGRRPALTPCLVRPWTGVVGTPGPSPALTAKLKGAPS